MASLEIGFAIGKSGSFTAATFPPLQDALLISDFDHVHGQGRTTVHGDADELLELAFKLHETALRSGQRPVNMRFKIRHPSRSVAQDLSAFRATP
jgi:hypothetical protein